MAKACLVDRPLSVGITWPHTLTLYAAIAVWNSAFFCPSRTMEIGAHGCDDFCKWLWKYKFIAITCLAWKFVVISQYIVLNWILRQRSQRVTFYNVSPGTCSNKMSQGSWSFACASQTKAATSKSYIIAQDKNSLQCNLTMYIFAKTILLLLIYCVKQ